MKTTSLVEALPLSVMRELTLKQKEEIIQSLDTRKIYGAGKYSQSELAIHQKFVRDQASDALKEAKDAYDEKKAAANEAQKALDQANAEVESAIKRRNSLQKEAEQKAVEAKKAEADVKAKEENFAKETELAKEMNTFVVVHSSATFEQISGYAHSMFFIAGDDDVLDVLKPESTLKKHKDYNWVKNIPDSLKKLPDGKRKDSIMEYCEMALDLSDLKKTNKDKNVVLLYNDKIIRETLEANGLSES